SEDTAFFLHLLVKSDKPVVVANSQRQHGTVGNDGDKNFVDAVRVVLSPAAAGKGAVVVSNQTINSGREVLKTSVRPDAFVSGEHGLLGIIEADRVDFYRAPTRRHTLRSEFDVASITALPKVEIVYSYFDADPALIEAAAKAGAKGVVVNGFTTGGSPYSTQQRMLQELAAKGVPVVLTARGGMNNRIPFDEANPFIEGDNFVAHKARILLQLALTRTTDPKEIQRIFDEY
ncbi:MAG: asparaginase domain-containing protein, partial [Terriglobia bacterium]